MEISVGGRRYENIRQNAYWNNVHLDSKFRPEKDEISDAVKHLEDCRKLPTVALLARKEARTNYYPDYFHRNLEKIYRESSAVRHADKAYRENYKSLYPQTGSVRKSLIDSKSIVLNYVKPIKKNLKRFLIKLFIK